MADISEKDRPAPAIPVLCASCVARRHGICAALSAEQLASLIRVSSRQHITQGGELMGEAEAMRRFFNLLSGVVKLTRALSDGRRQIVGLQFAPDFIGRPFGTESAVTAEAATDVELCALPRGAIERMIAEQPDLSDRLHRQALKDLDQAREWMVMLGRKTAAERVASFLLMIARNAAVATSPQPRGACFDLPLSRGEMADFLGLTIETVSRQLTRLRADGVIRVEHNRHLTVDDLDRLTARAGD